MNNLEYFEVYDGYVGRVRFINDKIIIGDDEIYYIEDIVRLEYVKFSFLMLLSFIIFGWVASAAMQKHVYPGSLIIETKRFSFDISFKYKNLNKLPSAFKEKLWVNKYFFSSY